MIPLIIYPAACRHLVPSGPYRRRAFREIPESVVIDLARTASEPTRFLARAWLRAYHQGVLPGGID